MRACAPRFRPLSTLPGTAITSRPYSRAQAAVISEPDFIIRLDDDHGSRQAADETIAHRKVKREWRRVRWILADDQALACDLAGKRPVFMWIDMVDSGAEDGDRPARTKCAAVGGGIDTARKSSYDCDALDS